MRESLDTSATPEDVIRNYASKWRSRAEEAERDLAAAMERERRLRGIVARLADWSCEVGAEGCGECLVCQARTALADAAPPEGPAWAAPLVWSTEPPKVPGWYWAEWPNGHRMFGEHAPGRIDNGAFLRARRWAGPVSIPEPEEPRKEVDGGD